MNLTDILSVIGGAVLGAAVAYINMRISKANMNASNMAAVMGVNMLRLLLDAARKTTHEWCANSLALCQKLDRRMKSEKGIDREGELKLLLMQLAQRA